MSLSIQVAVVAAALLLVAFAIGAVERRRRRSRVSWIDELASVRSDTVGVLFEVDDLEPTKTKRKKRATVERRELTGRQITGPGDQEFFEYGGEAAPLTRVSGEEHTVTNDRDRLVVEISRGSVWRLAESSSWHPTMESPLLIRTAAGDVNAEHTDLLVTCEPDGWTYVLCFAGSAFVSRDAESVALHADQVARMHVESSEVEVASVATGSLEGDEVVRLHRRLDRGGASLEPSVAGGRN